MFSIDRELVLGCEPCDEKVAFKGDYDELSDVVHEIELAGYGTFPKANSSEYGGGWAEDCGLRECPETGQPCPFKERINHAAELTLACDVVELLDAPTRLSEAGMLGYLNPATTRRGFS